YAGGIVVLFVFAILLTSHPGNNEKQLESRKRVRAMLLGVAMFVIGGISLVSRADSLLSRPDMPLLDMKALGTALMGTGHGQYLLPFEAVSILLLGCMIGGIVVARKK
ncbi:MAG: NADH-quinone oxidoreductase subunit J, partial [Muribaculaceae bacterium]|nr:NADH-quinone oxidoreductase subunit J [Muribaculaceae bacterium]